MIIEFIGSTGSGKTTLISEVQRRLAGQARAVTGFDLVASLLGLQDVTNPTLRNVIQDLVGLPFFLGSIYQHKAFLRFALRTLASQKSYTLGRANYVRSIVRKIGMYEICKRHNHNRIVLVDEGTLLAAHLLFVYTNTIYGQQDIAHFVRVVPLPDLAVYVKTPVDSLVKRSLQRDDPPREMRPKRLSLIEEYVTRATQIFDQLVQSKEMQERLFVVDNLDLRKGKAGAVADSIAEFVLKYKAGVANVHSIPGERVRPSTTCI